jgi:inosose dehydratase
VRSTNELSRAIAEAYGVAPQSQYHADSRVETPEQVERFLADTDPRQVSLCLDTGHYAYGGGDAAQLIRSHPDRVGYVHIKQMDPAVVARAEDLAFGQAVAQGSSCEPPNGLPDIPSVGRALVDRGADTFVIVEQDLYPVDFDVPGPIAARTPRYLLGGGFGE